MFHNYHKILYIRPTHLQRFTKYPQATCFGPFGPSSSLIYEPVHDDGPRGPKHVACGYFVRGCRCVGRIFYDTSELSVLIQRKLMKRKQTDLI